MPVLLFFLLLLTSQLALAQAGSRPPQHFDSVDAFYHTLSASLQVGVGTRPAVVPSGTLLLPDTMRYLLWAELQQGRLHVLEKIGNEGLVLRKTIPLSIGKAGFGKEKEGDRRTPVGVYRLLSHYPDAGLDDFYGIGAYPLNYPNPRDLQLGRTGHGIWLHGLPKHAEQRPLLDSDGCIVIDNDSLAALAGEILPGSTWLVASPEPLRWVPADSLRDRRNSLLNALLGWKQAWEALDHNAYMAFYAEEFSDLEGDRQNWDRYKQQVNARKQWVELDFAELSMLADPLDPNLVTVRYRQDYRSSNYRWNGWKEQIWQHSEQGWHILYEGNG